MQLVGVEITYEGVERNLGVKSGRNYAEIVVVNRYVVRSVCLLVDFFATSKVLLVVKKVNF